MKKFEFKLFLNTREEWEILTIYRVSNGNKMIQTPI